MAGLYDNKITDSDCTNCRKPLKDCACGDSEAYSFLVVVCPYCGHRNEPEPELEDYEEGQHERECGDCEKEFLLNVSVSWSWQSNRPEDMET